MAENDTIDVAKAQEFAGSSAKIASAIDSLKGHDGWKLFLLLMQYRRQEIKDREDYATLSDFQADRKALKIFDEILADFDGYKDQAENAQDLLKKLIERNQDTAEDPMILPGQQGEEVAEG